MSGGLDSAILAWWLLRKKQTVHPLYFQSGHVWEAAEIHWLRQFLNAVSGPHLKPLQILSSPTDDLYASHWSMTGKKIPGAKSSDWQVYLPGKNLLLITKAAVYCALHKIPVLALAPLKTNPFPDAKPAFFKKLEDACSSGLGFRFKIQTPFLKWKKKQVMQLGLNAPLHLTFSCLAPHPPLSLRERVRVREYRHCGTCNKCAERKKAFRDAGIRDFTSYAR